MVETFKNMKGLINFILSLAFFFVIISCDKNEDESIGKTAPVVDLGEDITMLEKMPIPLDAGNPGATYLWSTGETTQVIMVDTTGVYWVKVSNEGGSDSDTIVAELMYETIQVETGFGNFRIWLYNQTPLHKSNFISLTEGSFYNNLIFHRVILNFVIQGGDPGGTGAGGPGYTIPAEIIPGLDHDYGAVGAARMGDDVNPEKESNGSQFYIVTNPNGRPDLNGDYTVFAYVFDGIEIVYEISEIPVDANYRPESDVIMNSVTKDYFTAKELEDSFGFAIP